MTSGSSGIDLSAFSGYIAETLGLNFPQERWGDLQRGVELVAREFSFDDLGAFTRWLMSTPLSKKQLETLAGNLTIGETYFFRDEKSFETLAERILSPLIEERRKGERRLRIWSAGCCTGEEAYSIAIVLHRIIPDLLNWKVTLLATDISSRFLHKAESGIFSNWSFRGTPAWVKERYFSRTDGGGFQISPVIKKMVHFAQLNLAQDAFPSPVTDTHAMDIIFCRNVLMYFTEPQAKKVIKNFYRAQSDGGTLFVGASELLLVSPPEYRSVHAGETIYHVRDGLAQRPVPVWTFPSVTQEAETRATDSRPQLPEPPSEKSPVTPARDIQGDAAVMYGQGRYAEAAETLDELRRNRQLESSALGLLARARANQGKLAEALACCDEWIGKDKVNPSAHYLRAVILQERKETEEAVRSLNRVLYLDTEFVVAHFALAHIARERGLAEEALKHLRNVQQLLHRYRPEDPLPESEGVTAGRFAEIVNSLMGGEGAA